MAKAEQHNTLNNSQGSSQPGWSAIDLACKKMVLFDYVYLKHTTAVDISIDIAHLY